MVARLIACDHSGGTRDSIDGFALVDTAQEHLQQVSATSDRSVSVLSLVLAPCA